MGSLTPDHMSILILLVIAGTLIQYILELTGCIHEAGPIGMGET